MIKARVLSTIMSAKPDAPIEVNMEMWVFDNGSISCPDEVVIMTEEEYESLEEVNKALDSVSDGLRQSLLDEREKTRKLEEEVEDLKVKNADIRFDRGIINLDNSRLRKIVKEQSETIQKLEDENISIKKVIKKLEEESKSTVGFCPDGTIVFRSKKVSELEKKVKELEEKNKYLKKRLMTRYTVNFDADGAIIYPESKED